MLKPNTDINKNELYARLGVPELWRYNGQKLTIYQIQGGSYQEAIASPSFPAVPKDRLYRFLRDCAEEGETASKRALRAWIRDNL